MGRSQIVNLLICCTSRGKRNGKKKNIQSISHPPVLSPVLTRIFFLPSLVLLLAMGAEQEEAEEGNVQSEEEEMN